MPPLPTTSEHRPLGPCCSRSSSRFKRWSQRVFASMMAQSSPSYEKKMGDRKRALFAELDGTVLEIGAGTAPNLQYYSPQIHWIGIEPNPYMHPYIQATAAQQQRTVEIREGTAERIAADPNSVDAVVSTLVLCSVTDVAATLQEVLRVLKPGGKFLFIEHVAAPQGTWTRRLQRALRPLSIALGEGCHPDRETWVALENAGFQQLHYDQVASPMPLLPQIMGVAVK